MARSNKPSRHHIGKSKRQRRAESRQAAALASGKSLGPQQYNANGRTMGESLETSKTGNKPKGKSMHDPKDTLHALNCPSCSQRIHIPRPELFLIPRETFFSIETDDLASTYRDMESIGIANMPYDHIIIGVPGDIVLRSRLELDAQNDQLVHIYYPREDGPIDPRSLGMNTITNEDGKLAYKSAFDFIMKEWEEQGMGYQSRDWEFRFHYWNTVKGNIKLYRTLARFHPHRPWRDMSEFYIKDSSSKLSEKEREIARASLEIRLEGMAYTLKNTLIVLLATRNAIKTRTKDKLLALGIGKRKLKNNNKPLYTTTITVPKLPSGSPITSSPSGRTVTAHLRRGHKRDQRWGPKLQFIRPVWIAPCFVNGDDTYVSTRVAYNTNLIPPEHPDA